MYKKLFTYKEQLSTGVIFLACLALYLFFPTSDIFQQIISSIAFLLVIPLLYIKFILKKSLASYGIQKGDPRRGIFLMVISIIISLLLFYALFQYTTLAKFYSLPPFVTQNFAVFVIYEFFLVGLFTLLYEFFFRGLIMFGLFKNTGYIAILAQFIIFSGLFLASGDVAWSTILYMIVSIFSGITAYQSRSLFYSFGATLIFIIIADALAIGLIKQ